MRVHLRNGFNLDRDMGVTYHYIPIDIKDNFNFINAGHGRKFDMHIKYICNRETERLFSILCKLN